MQEQPAEAQQPPPQPVPPKTAADEHEKDADGLPKYGGFTRFEIECEFVQMLGSPRYLTFLASIKSFENPQFIKYLDYLQYWRKPQYAKYLNHPLSTFKALELLQQEQFRKDILNPGLADELSRQWTEAGYSIKPDKEVAARSISGQLPPDASK